MPKINVYLPDELAEAVKDLGVPVSAVCQRALEQAVRRLAAVRETARLDLEPDDSLPQLASFTARARTAVQLGIEQARALGAAEVGTDHLLAGMLAEGGNLALQVLRSLEIDASEVQQRLAGQPQEAAQADAPTPLRLNATAVAALELSTFESASLGHNYIGCEHLLLGLVAEPDGPAGQVLRSLGAERRLARRAVVAALGGYLHAQAQGRQPAVEGEAAPLRDIIRRLDRLEEQVNALIAS
jgi:ATP-dependent Clp protease ATP-binding subunit ClpC